MVIQLVKTGGAEASRISGTQAEVAGSIHQCGLGREVPVEGLVVGQTQAHGCRQAVKEQHLVLGEGGCRISILVDIARGGGEVILAPIGTKDGGGVVHQSQDSLELCLHRALLLGLHIIVDSIGLGGHVILLAVAEPVNGEIGLQGVAAGELVDTAHVPAQAFVAHLVVGTACDVLAGVGAVGDLVGVVDAGIQRQVLVGSIGELLAHEVGAVTREEGGDCRLGFGVRALDILHIVDAVTIGTVT